MSKDYKPTVKFRLAERIKDFMLSSACHEHRMTDNIVQIHMLDMCIMDVIDSSKLCEQWRRVTSLLEINRGGI